MRTVLSAVWVCLLVTGACLLPARAAEPDRAAFARAMGAVWKGMSAEEAVHLLGKPADIRTQFDPGGIAAARTTEIWGYGTAGHLTFPALGCLYIQEGAVQYVFGGKGTAPAATMFGEGELAALLRLLDATTHEGGRNPLAYIRIVNTLQPLGKDKALAAIDEYLRVSSEIFSDRIPLFLVLRLLFEVPADPGFMPRMRVGAPSVAEPKDPKFLPRFPWVLLDDVPLNLVNGYMLAGLRQPVAEHVEYFRKNGKLREHPLRPSNNPLRVLDNLEHSPLWIYRDLPGSPGYQWAKGLLAEQLLRLIDTVYRIEPDQHGHRLPHEHFDAQRWDRAVREVAALDIRWDAAKNRYGFADGTALPEVSKPIHRRQMWEVPGLGRHANLICERLNNDYVLLRLERSAPPGVAVPQSRMRVYRTGGDPPLAEYPIPYSDGGSSVFCQTSQDVRLAAGESLQAEMITGGEITRSPVMTP